MCAGTVLYPRSVSNFCVSIRYIYGNNSSVCSYVMDFSFVSLSSVANFPLKTPFIYVYLLAYYV